jgi:adenine-specific DNA-methyltransferase
MSIKVKHQSLPSSGEAREALRQKGQFWTPGWVAEAMVSYVLLDKSKIIFDPAVGEGAFFQAVSQISEDLGYIPRFIGREIDKDVLKKAQENNSFNDFAEIELLDFVLHPPKDEFSAIVANPPYIRHHRLSSDVKANLKFYGKKLLGKALDGRAGFHIYFLLKALQCLAPGGRLAFIMPSDTCEGIFAKPLWRWIVENYNLECVVTFSPEATPFPNVDTNAIIFFIRNISPTENLFWAKCTKPNTDDLKKFVTSEFQNRSENIFFEKRTIEEAVETGLSREKPKEVISGIPLKSIANVMRGIATGSNEFFFFTRKQATDLGIPDEFLKLAVGRTRDVNANEITCNHLKELDSLGRPTFLFAPDGRALQNFPIEVKNYLEHGEKLGLPSRSLISQRKPWYKMETRKPPTFLFAYLGRRNTRFIKNTAQVLPLTGFLCVYSKNEDSSFNDALWKALNHPTTLEGLKLVGKSYGDGAIKVEPRSLDELIIPFSVIEEVGLSIPSAEMNKHKSISAHQGNLFQTT